ncbi:hypothetical protein C8J57DRAFT_1516653 [Mycena rebaudengoi]|nr:hypothetical protein C8J57DRAFT_1516653 [Mycena rebaudengoi]
MGRGKIAICIAIIAMYLFSTLHSAARWVMVRSVFLSNDDTLHPILSALYFHPIWLNILSGFVLPANSLVADCIMTWRCWVIWDRKFKIVILPILCTIAGTALGFLTVSLQANIILNPNSRSSNPSSDSTEFLAFSAPYFILSLITTVLCTGLIILRISTVSSGGVNVHGRVFEILVESAALYCVVLIALLPFLINEGFTAAYPQAILVQITGIAPTLIVARVLRVIPPPKCAPDTFGSVQWQLPSL